MPWFKVDDGFGSSRAILSVPRRARCQVAGLWTLAGSWCARELTDGFVPSYLPAEFGATKPTVAHLVKAGLWTEVDGGWQFADWEPNQPTREQTLTTRAQEAERKRKFREAKKFSAKTKPESSGKTKPQVNEGASDECPGGTSASVRPESQGESQGESGHPDPTRPDHIKRSTHQGQSSHLGSADDEQPRGPAVDVTGWRLVRDEIPAEHPQAVRTALAQQAGALLKSGTPAGDVQSALALWLTKPNLGPGTLPSLVSEIVRTRTRSPTTEGAATTKARGWLEVGAELEAAEQAALRSDPEQKAIRR